MFDRRTETPDNVDPMRAGEPPVLGLSRFSMLAPFEIRSFRFQWPADLVTSWAFEMETMILGWYVLVETRSVLWLTVFGALQYFGTLIAPIVWRGGRPARPSQRAVRHARDLRDAGGGPDGAGVRRCRDAADRDDHCDAGGMVRPSDLGVRGALVAETMPNERLIGAMSIARTTSEFGARRRRARRRRRVRAVRHGAGLCGHHVLVLDRRAVHARDRGTAAAHLARA